MSRVAVAMQKLRAARRALGQCVYCGGVAVDTGTGRKRVCLECAVKLRESERQRDGWRRRLLSFWTYQEEAKRETIAASNHTDIGVQNDEETLQNRAA